MCSHYNKKEREARGRSVFYTCTVCGTEWFSQDDTPEVVIGYVKGDK